MIEATGTRYVRARLRDAIPSLAPREDFPILAREIHGKPLVFLDSAASSQKPRQVIDAMEHLRAALATRTSIAASTRSAKRRPRVRERRARRSRASSTPAAPARDHLHAQHHRGDQPRRALLGRRQPQAGRRDPPHRDGASQQHRAVAVARRSAPAPRVEYIPITDDGELDLDAFDAAARDARSRSWSRSRRCRTCWARSARSSASSRRRTRCGALVLVDGAQSVPHLPVDVRALDCDFLAFSGHKMLGPTGVGVLWGRRELLEAMPPVPGRRRDDPRGHIAAARPGPTCRTSSRRARRDHRDAIGLGAAIDYLSALGMERVRAHEQRADRVRAWSA